MAASGEISMAIDTPPPAQTPRRLSIHGGFAVIDQPQRRLHDHARAQGFADLGSYLQTRCQQQASPAQLASELATTPTVARHLLQQAGLAPSPRQVTAARSRRATTDQHLAARAAELGFATLKDYLTNGRRPDDGQAPPSPTSLACTRARCVIGSTSTACPRRRASRRPRRTIQRQRACWAAKRRARLVELGFADLEDYLRVRRVEQGWSLRHILAELQVGSAWLKEQMIRLDIP